MQKPARPKAPRRLIPRIALTAATLFLAGCNTLFGRISGFWELSCLGAVAVILDIIALVELAGSGRPMKNRVLWGLVIILLPYLGCLLYYAFGR